MAFDSDDQRGGGVQSPVLTDQQDDQDLGIDQLAAALEDLVEHRLRVGDRAADDLQHLGGGGLLLQRLLRLVVNSRALSSATPMLAAMVLTRRTSASP